MSRRDSQLETSPVVTRKRRIRWNYERPAFVDSLDRVTGDHAGYLVCGPAPTVPELAQLAADGWTVAAEGHRPTLKRDGITVRWAHMWTAGVDVTPSQMAELWTTLEARLQLAARDVHACPLGSPATTGRDLFVRTLPAGVEYPVMHPEWQRIVRGTTGQARVELRPVPAQHPGHERPDRLPSGVVEYDARSAYLAQLDRLPIGEPVQVSAFDPTEADPYSPCRVHATWRAPAGWAHVGILPERTDTGRMSWPTSGAGWLDAVEVDCARRYGWRVDVHDALVWPKTDDPFTWWRRAVDVLESPPDSWGTDWTTERAWRGIWRGLTLHTIGAMHGAARRTTHYGPEAPDDALDVQLDRRTGAFRWKTLGDAAWPNMSHPEWSTTIWARARVRLLRAPGGRGALQLPAGSVVALRTDALYIDARHDPRWADDGRRGSFRFTGRLPLSSWPTSTAELLAAKKLRTGGMHHEYA